MMEKRELEAKLSEVLIPVEPSARFVRHLRAKLVNYQGGQTLSTWTLIVLIGTTILMLLASLGAFARLIVSIIAILGFLSNRRRGTSEKQVQIS